MQKVEPIWLCEPALVSDSEFCGNAHLTASPMQYWGLDEIGCFVELLWTL